MKIQKIKEWLVSQQKDKEQFRVIGWNTGAAHKRGGKLFCHVIRLKDNKEFSLDTEYTFKGAYIFKIHKFFEDKIHVGISLYKGSHLVFEINELDLENEESLKEEYEMQKERERFNKNEK